MPLGELIIAAVAFVWGVIVGVVVRKPSHTTTTYHNYQEWWGKQDEGGRENIY
jgi:hypothetical protein